MNEQATPQPQAAPPTKELKGIGGWLLVYVILIFVWIAFILLGWLSAEAVVRKYPQLAELISTARIIWIIGLALSVAQLVVIFMKMKWVPMAIMVLLAIGIVINVISLILNPSTTGSIVTGIISIIIGLLWIGYFSKSVRVKNTFVK
jgi:hypothetical protein